MIHNQIITYGLTNEEIVELQNVKPNKDCSIIIADCATDIIAIGAYTAIVRKSKLDQSDYDLLSSYLEEVGDYADTVILIGEDDKLKSFSKKVKIFATFEDFLEKAKYTFVASYAKHRQSDEFSSKISLALRMVILIKRNPGISTAVLADKLDMSTRSVQRYIETLRMSGEWIDYDTSLHGWRLEHEKSFLLDFEDADK